MLIQLRVDGFDLAFQVVCTDTNQPIIPVFAAHNVESSQNGPVVRVSTAFRLCGHSGPLFGTGLGPPLLGGVRTRDPRRSPGSWMHHSARNQAINSLRRETCSKTVHTMQGRVVKFLSELYCEVGADQGGQSLLLFSISTPILAYFLRISGHPLDFALIPVVNSPRCTNCEHKPLVSHSMRAVGERKSQ